MIRYNLCLNKKTRPSLSKVCGRDKNRPIIGFFTLSIVSKKVSRFNHGKICETWK